MDVSPRDPRPRIVIVDDDDVARRSMHLVLLGRGYEVRAFASGAAVLADETTLAAACLVCVQRPGGLDGPALLGRLRAHGGRQSAILVMPQPIPGLAAQARDAGFADILEMPLKPRRLVNAVARLLSGPATD